MTTSELNTADQGEVLPTGLIKRGPRMFIQLAAIGECDEKGKTVLSIGFKGKAIADPDRPLGTLVIGLIEQIVGMARYTSDDAVKADLAALSAYVARLEVRTPAEATPAAPPVDDQRTT